MCDYSSSASFSKSLLFNSAHCSLITVPPSVMSLLTFQGFTLLATRLERWRHHHHSHRSTPPHSPVSAPHSPPPLPPPLPEVPILLGRGDPAPTTRSWLWPGNGSRSVHIIIHLMHTCSYNGFQFVEYTSGMMDVWQCMPRCQCL